MAESSIFWTTGTTGDGTTTYTEAQTTAFFGDCLTPNSTITSPHASQGVLPGAGGELAVTGTSSPVSVAAGAALTEGYAYRNTAAVTVAIPTPGAATRIDRVVLRVSHSTTRTVRITRIAGTEGAGAPSLTQVAGTTWDIPLAQCSITTGGVITVTDDRSFAHFATRLDRSRIDGGTSARVPFNDANGRLTDDSALTYDTTNKRLRVQGGIPAITLDETDNAVKGALIALNNNLLSFSRMAGAFGAQEAVLAILDLLNGQLTVTPQSALPPLIIGASGQGQTVDGLAADEIDTLSYRRQGGDATNWDTQGTTTYTPTTMRRQVGSRSQSISSGTAQGSVTITYPVAYSAPPIVTGSFYALAVNELSSQPFLSLSSTATQLTITVRRVDTTSTLTYTVHWNAEGPE